MSHSNSFKTQTLKTESVKISSEISDEIFAAIKAIRFGSVEITVHDGRVTQIERREKVRFQEASQKEIKPTAELSLSPAAKHFSPQKI